MPIPLRYGHVFTIPLLILLASGITKAEPPSAKPPEGVQAGQADDAAEQKAADARAEEERKHRPYIEACQARDNADLARAAYEAACKPGPIPPVGNDAFNAMIDAYNQAIARPTLTPELAEIVCYTHLRLAGAYQYTQQFGKAVEECKKTERQFAGRPQQLQAAYAAGLIYLQALHDPNSAVGYFTRARDMAKTLFTDPDQQNKWLTATTDAIQRCKNEPRK